MRLALNPRGVVSAMMASWSMYLSCKLDTVMGLGAVTVITILLLVITTDKISWGQKGWARLVQYQ